MRLSRRGLLRAGLAGTAATALGGLATGCGVPTGSTGRNMVLWYWSGGLSPKVVQDAKTRYDSAVNLQAIQIGGYYRSKLLTTMTGRAHIPDIAGLKGEDMASYLPNSDQFVDLRTLGADKLKDQYLPWKWEQGIAEDGSMVGFPSTAVRSRTTTSPPSSRRPDWPTSRRTCPRSWPPGTSSSRPASS